MTAATSLDQSLLYPSPLKEFWQAFSHNKGAVCGLGFMLLMVFCALFAPGSRRTIPASSTATSCSPRRSGWMVVSGASCSAPTSWAVTCSRG